MIRKIFVLAFQFLCVLAIIDGALVVWDLHHNGMEYAHTPLFSQDLMTYGRVALAATLLIFLVAVCYSATRRTMRLPGNRNDPDIW